MASRVFVALVMCAHVGCNQQPLAAPITARMFFDDALKRSCSIERACCGSAESEADCVARKRAENGVYDAVEAAVKAGTSVVDQTRAARCIARPMPACDDKIPDAEAEACQPTKIIRGTIPLGDPCNPMRPDFCSPDGWCSAAGKCEPFPNEGAACNFACADGLDCVNAVCVGPSPPTTTYRQSCR